jgi:hypothetical protein
LRQITTEGKTEEPKNEKLLKIGELAKATKQTALIIRHWTKEGLLQVAEITEIRLFWLNN